MKKLLERVTKEKIGLVREIFDDFKHKTLVHKKTIFNIEDEYQERFNTENYIFPPELNYLTDLPNTIYCYQTNIIVDSISIAVILIDCDHEEVLSFGYTHIEVGKNTYYVFLPFKYKDFILLHEISHIVDFHYSKFCNFVGYIDSFSGDGHAQAEIIANILSIGYYNDTADGVIGYIEAVGSTGGMTLNELYINSVFIEIMNNLNIIKDKFLELK